jgi:hypothetical protein
MMDSSATELEWIPKEGIMISKSDLMKNVVRPIGLSWVFVAFGSLLALFLKVFLDLEVPKLYASGITFVFAAFAAFYLFPRRLEVPFRDLD